jgi:hypothetical protein
MPNAGRICIYGTYLPIIREYSGSSVKAIGCAVFDVYESASGE